MCRYGRRVHASFYRSKGKPNALTTVAVKTSKVLKK